MRRVLLIILFVLTAITNWCQIKPNGTFGYSYLIGTPSANGGFQELQFGAGSQLNKFFFAQINYRYMFYELNSTSDPFVTMRNGIFSVTGGYRILGDKRFSPLVILDFGVPIHSNANGAFMVGQAHMVKQYYPGVWRYNRGLFFGKFKLMSDIKVKSFNILIGASFNLWYASASTLGGSDGSSGYYYYYVKDTSIGGEPNFGLEAGLMYTFPGKKDKQE